jgi:hypothetical protein
VEILITRIRIKRSRFKSQLAKHSGIAVLSVFVSSCVEWNLFYIPNRLLVLKKNEREREKYKCCKEVMESLDPFLFFLPNSWQPKEGNAANNKLYKHRFFVSEY